MNLNEIESRFVFAQNFDMIEKCKSLMHNFIHNQKFGEYCNYKNYLMEIAKVPLWKKFLLLYKFIAYKHDDNNRPYTVISVLKPNHPLEYVEAMNDFYFDIKLDLFKLNEIEKSSSCNLRYGFHDFMSKQLIYAKFELIK